DLGDGLLQALRIGGVVERPAGLLGAQERAQRRRADEAADMGGEDPIGAAFHLASSPASRRSLLPSTTTAYRLTAQTDRAGPRAGAPSLLTPRSGVGRPPRKSIRSSVGAERAPDRRGRPGRAAASSATSLRAACACARACVPGGSLPPSRAPFSRRVFRS